MDAKCTELRAMPSIAACQQAGARRPRLRNLLLAAQPGGEDGDRQHLGGEREGAADVSQRTHENDYLSGETVGAHLLCASASQPGPPCSAMT